MPMSVATHDAEAVVMVRLLKFVLPVPNAAGLYCALMVTFGESRPLSSVSYTHLRAHETVLDLVCRLLLEKKTNQLPP